MDNPYYDRQLKTILHILSHDYAGLALTDAPVDARYYTQAAGMAWKKGELDQLLFLRYVSQMLATTMDRTLRLTVLSQEYHPWHVGFDVRRVGDALYVIDAREDARLHAGDKIVAINGRSPGEHRARFQKNFLYSGVAEREMWGNVLKMAERVVAQRENGGEEELPLHRIDGARPCEPTRVERLSPTAVQLIVGNVDDESFEAIVAENQAALDDAETLIMDLRHATGSDPEAIMPLVPYILSEAKTMNEAAGLETWRTLYSPANCRRRLEQLAPYRDDPEGARLIQEIEERFGAGWVSESCALWDDVPEPIQPRGHKVLLLTDTWTEGAPETLALLAKKEGRVESIGRATMGSLDYSSHIQVRISDTALLTYPTAITEAAANGNGYRGKGVQPDRIVPFTPEECHADIVLKQALS